MVEQWLVLLVPGFEGLFVQSLHVLPCVGSLWVYEAN